MSSDNIFAKLRTNERSVETQVASLNEAERAALDELRSKWESKERGVSFADEMLLRFLRCSPGSKKFVASKSYPVMKKFAEWGEKLGVHGMRVEGVAKELREKVLFVPPGMLSKDAHEFLYMRPARYFPAKTSVDELLQTLVYVLAHLTESEKGSREGVAFMANMADWGWSNFSLSYAKSFFDTVQGRFPVRIRLFLIVDPPSWFGAVWRLIRPMMTKDFAEKVKLVKGSELPDYLHPNSPAEAIPDEIDGGLCDMDAAIEEFIAYRKQRENERELAHSRGSLI